MEQHQIDQSIRLKKLIKALNINQVSFARSLGMAQPNISRMVSGAGSVSVEVLNRIAAKYMEVNLHWLLTGNGEMFLNGRQDTSLQVNESQANYGKGKWEDLEERVAMLEKSVKQLLNDKGK